MGPKIRHREKPLRKTRQEWKRFAEGGLVLGVGDGVVWAWMEAEVKCPPNGKDYVAAGEV